MKQLLISILLIGVVLCSCGKEENPEDFYFIFGKYAGECVGNCADFYYLENDNLFADDIEYFFHDINQLQWQATPLSTSQYDTASELLDDIPNQLFSIPDSTFGMPDAYDQGGYFVAYSEGGDTFEWNIDTNPDALPDYLKNFIVRIEETLLAL